MKPLYVFAFIALAFCTSWTTPSTETFIAWNEYDKLSWTDFRGHANEYSHADAATAVHISAKPFRKGKRLFYTVDAYFIPEQSWYRSRSSSLLAHEQLHFDIAELYARKARKKISELRQMGITDVHEYNREIKRILQESNKVDARYDHNTLHGSIGSRQKKWEAEIHQELKVLKAFSRENWR
jgi:hypothetical protein